MKLKSVSFIGRAGANGIASLVDNQVNFIYSPSLRKSHEIISYPMSDMFFFKYWITSRTIRRLDSRVIELLRT